MLAVVLTAAVGHQERPAAFEALLADIARQHREGGVRPDHFGLFVDLLVEVISEFDADHWSPGLERSWRTSLAGLSQELVAAAEKNRPELERSAKVGDLGHLPREYVTRNDQTLVRASLGQLKADPQFFSRFYTRLFERHPEIRGLFGEDLTSQHRKLELALNSVVAAFAYPAGRRAMLKRLGEKHRHAGVRLGHYAPFYEVLMDCISDVFSHHSASGVATTAAWSRALSEISRALAQDAEV